MYLEAEFFGGVGSQAAVGWDARGVGLAPRLTQTPGEDREGFLRAAAQDDLAINAALRWLGVSAASAADGFDALGLGELDELREEVPSEDRAVSVVQAWLATVRALAPVIGAEELGSLMSGVRSGLPHCGITGPGLRYRLHGRGCRYALLEGAIVDVALGPGGSLLVFDAWCVRGFGHSIGHELTADDEPALAAALRQGPGVSENEPGWFTIDAGTR